MRKRSTTTTAKMKREEKTHTSAGSSTSITLPSLSVAVSFTNGNEEAGGNPPWSPMTEAASAAAAACAEPEGEVFEEVLLLGDSALSAAADAVTSSRSPAIRLARPSVENMASQSRGRGLLLAAASAVAARRQQPAASAVTSVPVACRFDGSVEGGGRCGAARERDLKGKKGREEKENVDVSFLFILLIEY